MIEDRKKIPSTYTPVRTKEGFTVWIKGLHTSEQIIPSAGTC